MVLEYKVYFLCFFFVKTKDILYILLFSRSIHSFKTAYKAMNKKVVLEMKTFCN